VLLLLLSAVIAMAIAFAAFRRAPAATVLVACGLGAAVHFGLLTPPGAITAPIARASSAVRTWQAAQSAKLVCVTAETRALERDDESALDALNTACQPTTR
jgi:hypothetical protein